MVALLPLHQAKEVNLARLTIQDDLVESTRPCGYLSMVEAAMKKLKVEELAVDSFEAVPAGAERGTVHGAEFVARNLEPTIAAFKARRKA